MKNATTTFAACLEKLKAEAVLKGVSKDLSTYAAEQTSKYLRMNRASVDARGVKRIRSYFWAVVKRRAATDKKTHKFTERAVLSVFVNTLKNGGRKNEDIASELVRNYGQTMSSELIDEYLTALQAA